MKSVAPHTSARILLLSLCALAVALGAGGRPEPFHTDRTPREEGWALGAVAVPALCRPARSAAESVRCALAGASSLFSNRGVVGPALVVFPEATGWKDGLLAPERDRRAALREFAVAGADLKVGAEMCADADGQAGSTFLAGMACLAMKHGVEVVFDMLVEETCASPQRCGPDGVLLYNSAVALTAAGKLAAVYWKTHVFSTAPFLDEPSVPDAVTFFSMALGRPVGLMVCYDLDFRRPAADLLDAGVDTFAMPFDWPSVPPLFSPTMLQQAWSRVHGVQLLASDIVDSGGGSGIFRGGAVVASSEPGVLEGQIIFAHMPRGPGAPILETHAAGRASLGRGGSQRWTVGESVVPTQRSCSVASFSAFTGNCATLGDEGGGSIRASHGRVTCDASVHNGIATGKDGAPYVVFAFDGEVATPGTPDSLRAAVCAVMQCVPTSDDQDGGDPLMGRPHGSPQLLCGAENSGTLAATTVRVRATLSHATDPGIMYPMAAIGRGELLPPSKLRFEEYPAPDGAPVVSDLSIDVGEDSTLYSVVAYRVFV